MNDIRITFRGNAGENPQLWTNGARPFARVNVACTPRIRVDGEWQDGDTQWIQVKAWGRLARNMAASVRKGDAVMVTGSFRHEEYTNDAGKTFKTAVVHAFGVGFDLVRTCAMTATVRDEQGPGEAGDHLDQGEGEVPSPSGGWSQLGEGETVSEADSRSHTQAPF